MTYLITCSYVDHVFIRRSLHWYLDLLLAPLQSRVITVNHSAIANLPTSQFTWTRLVFSAFTSRILATDL
jgi:hypothetical protein